MSTRHTVARVRGVSRWSKNLDHTCTYGTRFGSTAGLTVPVLNATPRQLPRLPQVLRKYQHHCQHHRKLIFWTSRTEREWPENNLAKSPQNKHCHGTNLHHQI